MIIEVLSSESNKTNWVLMAFRRRGNIFTDEICNEVAKELRLNFERKNDGHLFFKDILCS